MADINLNLDMIKNPVYSNSYLSNILPRTEQMSNIVNVDNDPLGVSLCSNDVPTNNISDYTRGIRGNSNENWPMFKNTADRQGSSTSKIPGTITVKPKILWTNKTSKTYSSPVIRYGKVYLTTADGQIFCFEENTGKLCWDVSVSLNKLAPLSTPSIENGYLVVYNPFEGKVYRLDAFTSKLNWTFSVPGNNSKFNKSYINQPMLTYNGCVLFGSPDRYFYCLNESTGKLVWSFKTNEGLTYDYGIIGGAAAVNDSVYFGACDGYIYCLDLSSGNERWKYFTGDSISSTPVLYNNYVYITVGVHNSTLGDRHIYKIFCLDNRIGALKWEYKTNDHIITSPAVGENRVVFGSLDSNVYCLNIDSNTSAYSPFYANTGVWSSPIIADGKIVFGTMDSKLYCLYAQTGIIFWDLILDNPISSSPALANNRIFINTQSGKLYSIGPPDTSLPFITSTNPPEAAIGIPVSNRITVKFSERLCPDTINPKTVMVFNDTTGIIPIEIEYNDITKTITIIPKLFLNISTGYKIKLTIGIKDFAGNRLDGNKNGIPNGSPVDDYIWSFTTSSNHPPELTEPTVSPKSGSLGTTFIFSVLYTDRENNPPGVGNKDILIYFNNRPFGYRMELNDTPGTPAKWRNNNYEDGEQFIYKIKLNAEGIYNYRIWCHDGTDWNETKVFGLPVIPGPPRIKKIPLLNIDEDIELRLNLTNYITDPDTPLENLIIIANSSFVSVDGLIVTFLYPNSFTYPSGSRYDIVNISVTDQRFFSTTEIKLWVNQINDPPIIKPIPDQLLIEKSTKELNLKSYISDVDNKFEELKIQTDSKNAQIDGKYLKLYYSSVQEPDIVNLNISDGQYLVEEEIKIEVVSSQIPFVIDKIPELQVLEDIEFKVDMKKYLIMIKGTYGDLKVSCTSKYSQINNLSIILLYTDTFFTKVGGTQEEVKISVETISGDYSQSTNLKVSIIAINDAPELIDGKVNPSYGNITEEFTFEVNYYDPDGSNNYKVFVVVDYNKYEMLRVSGKRSEYPGVKFNFSEKLGIGYHYYYFKCNDGSGAPNSEFSTEIKKFFITGNLDSCYSGLEPKPGATETQDLDKDGIPDCWEMMNGLDPLNGSDALIDTDGDNFNNLLEYLGHDGLPTGNDSTDPKNAKDKPKTESIGDRQGDSTFNFWQLFFAVIGLIIIISIIIYSLFSSRGVGISIRVPKIMMSPEVTGEHPYTEDTFTGDERISYNQHMSDKDHSGVIEVDLSEEDLEGDIPAEYFEGDMPLEVDLTEDDKPFLESEELYEEGLSEEEPGTDAEIFEDTPKDFLGNGPEGKVETEPDTTDDEDVVNDK